ALLPDHRGIGRRGWRQLDDVVRVGARAVVANDCAGAVVGRTDPDESDPYDVHAIAAHARTRLSILVGLGDDGDSDDAARRRQRVTVSFAAMIEGGQPIDRNARRAWQEAALERVVMYADAAIRPIQSMSSVGILVVVPLTFSVKRDHVSGLPTGRADCEECLVRAARLRLRIDDKRSEYGCGRTRGRVRALDRPAGCAVDADRVAWVPDHAPEGRGLARAQRQLDPPGARRGRAGGKADGDGR